MLISHKGNLFTSWTSLIQVENSSCCIESQDTARETRFWDTREKWSKQPVLTMIRKGKNKKLITDSPGRKIRSRELKVCRFPQFKHFRGKSRHSPRPRTELSFAPLLPPALSSLRMLCSKHISAYWKKYLQRHLHSSLTCNYFTYRQKNLEKLKKPTSPVLSQERFRNNYFLPGDQPLNLFLDCSLLRESS